MEWGFGAPGPKFYHDVSSDLTPGGVKSTDTVDTLHFDWGFGDPKPYSDDVFDSGYGSPWSPAVSVSGLGVSDSYSLGVFPDHGGVFVVVSGDFDTKKKIRVRLEDATGVVHPSIGFCYSGVPGQGHTIYSPRGATFKFVLPPLKLGTYSIRYYYGETDQTGFLIEDSVRIATRNRSPETHSIRMGFPLLYKTGPANLRQEPVVTDVGD